MKILPKIFIFLTLFKIQKKNRKNLEKQAPVDFQGILGFLYIGPNLGKSITPWKQRTLNKGAEWHPQSNNRLGAYSHERPIWDLDMHSSVI